MNKLKAQNRNQAQVKVANGLQSAMSRKAEMQVQLNS